MSALEIAAALHQAADAMFLEAAPEELPLAADCPEAHAALVRQAAAAVAAFLRALPPDRLHVPATLHAFGVSIATESLRGELAAAVDAAKDRRP